MMHRLDVRNIDVRNIDVHVARFDNGGSGEVRWVLPQMMLKCAFNEVAISIRLRGEREAGSA
jgi:hypothetical protein